jgi:hypothetical protein
MALRGAYRAIAAAQAVGASTYLDAAKNHYRDAIARFGRQDPGTVSDAMAATALARAAIADHPLPIPRDIPTPPAIADGGGPPMRPRPPMAFRRGMMRRPFDPAALAQDAKLANTPEATDLANKAVDADIARTRAAFSGNRDEAMRQGRLADALAMAVRAIARADHPPSFPGRAFPGARRLPT